jgi:hypothetical protein
MLRDYYYSGMLRDSLSDYYFHGKSEIVSLGRSCINNEQQFQSTKAMLP